MICSSILKTGKTCPYKSKNVITFNNENYFFCGRHTLSGGNHLIGEKFISIDCIPNCRNIMHFAQESIPKVGIDVSDIIDSIKNISNMCLFVDLKIVPDHSLSMDRYKVKTKTNDELFLMICNDEDMIVEYYEALCIQSKVQETLNIFIPIETYEVFSKKYFITKLVHNQSPLKSYFYQVTKKYNPICSLNLESLGLSLFVHHMCRLIQNLHSARMCFGNYNFNTLVMLNEFDIESIRIISAVDITFWIDIHGDFKSESRSCNGSTDPSTSSRRVHAKQAPSRFDDIESLLYLILTIQKKILPWHDSISLRDTIQMKDVFLSNASLYIKIKNETALKSLCSMISVSVYEERPPYDHIEKLLIQIIET
jgi:hypothetical protein